MQSEEEKSDRISPSFKLDVIALGDEPYLDEIWAQRRFTIQAAVQSSFL